MVALSMIITAILALAPAYTMSASSAESGISSTAANGYMPGTLTTSIVPGQSTSRGSVHSSGFSSDWISTSDAMPTVHNEVAGTIPPNPGATDCLRFSIFRGTQDPVKCNCYSGGGKKARWDRASMIDDLNKACILFSNGAWGPPNPKHWTARAFQGCKISLN